MINKVTLIGHLGKDPEMRRLESGVAVAQFSLATNESYKDKNGEWQTLTEWHNVVAWRDLAESAERNLKKGKLAYVEGKLTHRKYQDKEGQDRYITEVVAHVLRLLEKREGGGFLESSFPTAESEPVNLPKNTANVSMVAEAPATQPDLQEAPISGDDLPF